MQILGLFTTPRARQWLRRSTEQWARLTLAESPAAVDAALQRARADVLILEVDVARDSLEPFVRHLRRQYPSLAVVLYCPPSTRIAREILKLAKAGADELIAEGFDDDGRSVRRIVAAAATSRCSARSLAILGEHLPSRAKDIVARSLELASAPISVRQLAAAVGVNRKTLVNRLTAAGLPGPSVLISWCRVLIACELLQDPGRSVEQVALLLGFGSGVALRNMFRRHLRLRPSALREPGAADAVMDRLLAGVMQRGTPRGVAFVAHSVTAN